MKANIDAQPKTFEEALQLVQATPSLRKIKSFLDNSDLSADLKALLYDVASVTVKIGEAVVAIGRRIFEIASALISKFPNLAIGTLVGVTIAAVLTSSLGAVPVIGALAALLSKLVVLLGVGKGFVDDLRNNAAKAEMDRVSAQFNALGMGFVQS
jgi:hypothetical protein